MPISRVISILPSRLLGSLLLDDLPVEDYGIDVEVDLE